MIIDFISITIKVILIAIEVILITIKVIQITIEVILIGQNSKKLLIPLPILYSLLLFVCPYSFWVCYV